MITKHSTDNTHFPLTLIINLTVTLALFIITLRLITFTFVTHLLITFFMYLMVV